MNENSPLLECEYPSTHFAFFRHLAQTKSASFFGVVRVFEIFISLMRLWLIERDFLQERKPRADQEEQNEVEQRRGIS